MYLWKHYSTGRWLAKHERGLEEIAPGRVVVISRPGRSRSLVQVACKSRAEVSNLRRRFRGAGECLPHDWRQKYLQAEIHPPLRIGRRLLVVTQSARSRRPQLVIPAAGAFGTGDHATTAMCLRLLEETTRNFPADWRMLDAGTGTGILALAARRFGAKEVIGIDNDPRAVAHAWQNARLNRIKGAKFLAADLLQWKAPRGVDLITANLFSDLLIAALPIFRRALQPQGRLIFSGVLRSQETAVVRAICSSQFALERRRRRGKWIALLAQPSVLR